MIGVPSNKKEEEGSAICGMPRRVYIPAFALCVLFMFYLVVPPAPPRPGATAPGIHAGGALVARARSQSDLVPKLASDFLLPLEQLRSKGHPGIDTSDAIEGVSGGGGGGDSGAGGGDRGTLAFTLGLVADPDKSSKREVKGKKTEWRSSFKTVYLVPAGHDGRAPRVVFGTETPLKSRVAEAGRAMELSDLTLFDNRLVTMDDRTGIVFEVLSGARAVPRHILMDGDGESEKGFKGEWATVKDGLLYIGGMGKEWTDNNGEILSQNPCWVKTLDPSWGVTHENWSRRYTKVRQTTGHTHPGYILHEAVAWRASSREWYLLPRRASKDPYNDVADERRATNLLIIANEDFTKVRYSTLGPLEPTRGFSSFAFFPGDDSKIIAVKSQEVEGDIASFLVAYDINGNVLLDEVPLGKVKYEGVEFIPNAYGKGNKKKKE